MCCCAMRTRSESMRTLGRCAFSLAEVVIAIGVVAFALVGILGLFASLAHSSTEQADRQKAQTACAMAVAFVEGRGYAAAVPGMLVDPGQTSDEANTVYMSSDLRVIGQGADMPVEKRYYAVCVERNDELSPTDAAGRAVFMAVRFRIEWPMGGGAVPGGARFSWRMNHVLLRE